MPDADVWLNPGAPPGSADGIVVWIDNDNNSGTERFAVENDGGGLTRRVFEVDESGDVHLRGPLESSGTMQFNHKVVGGGDPIAFSSNGTEVARIESDGLGRFTTGGVNLPLLAATPHGSRVGVAGDVVLFDAGGGTFHLMVCAGGNSWSNA